MATIKNVLTIKFRLILISVSIVVVAMLLLAIANFATTRSSTMEKIEAQIAQLSEGRSSAISEWIKTRRAVVSSIKDNADATDVLPFLKAAQIAGNFELAMVGFADKRIVFSKPQPNLPPDYDPTIRPWYKQAIAKGRAILTDPYEDPNSKKLVVSFAEPAKLEGSVVAAGVFLDAVVDTVLSVKPTPSSYAFLTDGSGRIIAHPNRKLVLKPVSEADSHFSSKVLQDMAASKTTYKVDINGQATMVRVSTIASTDWLLAVVFDEREATEVIGDLLKGSLITALLASTLAAVVLSLLINRIMRRMTNVRDALNDIALGERDLTRRLDASGNDELSQIARAFNHFVDEIAHVLVDIRNSSVSVRIAAMEIASGNLDLSARTEQQSGSLQKTTAAMEQLITTVRQNADNARQANEVAEGASAIAVQGGSAVSNVVSTMNAISTSSQRINEIIGVIDGIAFQTNILALNAAVEAARAGEHGRGFAVVASEVRNLAQRASASAKEIRELINDSARKVMTGNALVDDAGKTMSEVVSSVRRMTEIMSEILTSTTEQSAGIEQVNRSLVQMDTVTQQNAALVEEAASAAGSLQDQATTLANIVAEFKLQGDEAEGHHGMVALNSGIASSAHVVRT